MAKIGNVEIQFRDLTCSCNVEPIVRDISPIYKIEDGVEFEVILRINSCPSCGAEVLSVLPF